MRVLVMTKIFPNALEPLSAPFNRQQIAALARRCEVSVLAAIPWFPGAKVFARWSPAGRLVGVPANDRIDGVEVAHPRVMYLPRFGHVLSAALYVASMWPVVSRRRGQFDVLLASWAYPDGVAAVALGRALGVPTVVKLHGSDIDVLARRPSLRAQLAWALPRAARIVAVSRALADAVEAMGVPRSRIDIVTNGVDGALFHPRDRAEARAAIGYAGDARKWIVFVGRLEAEKGIIDLAAAFTRLAVEVPDAALVLVGDGRGRDEAQKILSPLADRVVFAGARPLAEIPSWMAAADLVTLPSHHEGTPNVLLEALACGRRIVATDVGGIPDVVSRPELGRLVPVGDDAALAGALAGELAKPYDTAAVAALGARGGWSESAGRLLDVLERARGVAPAAAGGGGPWPAADAGRKAARDAG
jgi:glycosyltransferase involved in cell wall biosynthesis